jgi:signal transduction histidine kinase
MHSPRPSDARRAFDLVALVDYFVPEELLRSSDSRLRARVLVGSSTFLGLFSLIIMIVLALTRPLDAAFWVSAVDVVVVLALPVVQRLTRSNRIAGGLLTALLLFTFPFFLHQVGMYPAPVVLLFPLIPLIATYFVGVGLGLVSTLMIAAASLGVGLSLPTPLMAPFDEFRPTFLVVGTVTPLMCFMLAALQERNRQRNEQRFSEVNLALADARNLAEAADRRKTEFLQQVSHELRTPLNAIVGYSELLREQADEIPGAQVLGEDLDRIGAASKHLLALINGLLDINKIEAGGITLVLEEIELRALFDELRGTIAPLVEGGGNTLVMAIEPGAGRLRSDRQRLQQVLINLAGNACKFTERGTITIRASGDGTKVRVEVVDSGVGMDPERLGTIFDPFVQLGDLGARGRQGSGLGLAISKKLVEQLGGTIGVRSRPGEGSTFSLELPVAGPPA